MRKTRGTITELDSAFTGRKIHKKSKVFFKSSGRFGCALNVHTEGKKKKKDEGGKPSFPEKGIAGDTVQQVVRFSFWGLGQ